MWPLTRVYIWVVDEVVDTLGCMWTLLTLTPFWSSPVVGGWLIHHRDHFQGGQPHCCREHQQSKPSCRCSRNFKGPAATAKFYQWWCPIYSCGKPKQLPDNALHSTSTVHSAPPFSEYSNPCLMSTLARLRIVLARINGKGTRTALWWRVRAQRTAGNIMYTVVL